MRTTGILLGLLSTASAAAQDGVRVPYGVEDDIVMLECIPPETVADLRPLPGSRYVCYDLDEIVTVGDRIGFSALETLTSPVTVIDETFLRDRGQGAATQILRTVPGLAVSTSGNTSGLAQLRLRGAEANQIVVLIDGVEVANPADGAFDFGGLRTEHILRVEVLRGEQSALWGADAIGGVINILTRAIATRESWRASVEAGSRDTLEGSVTGVVPLPASTLSITGTAFRTGGYDISGTGGDADSADSRSVNLGFNTDGSGPVDLSARFGFTNRRADFDEDADFDGRLDDTDSDSVVETTTGSLRAGYNLADTDFVATLSRFETDTDTRAGFSSRTTGTREQANLIAKRAFGSHALTALGEYERESYAFAGDPDTPDIDTWSGAIDYRYAGDALTLTGSVRHDSNSLFDDATTWRAGVGYAHDDAGRFTASVGTGTKTPTLVELFGFFPASNFVGNADLQPENSLGYTVGYTRDLGDGRIGVHYFRSELSDEIVTLFNPDFTTSLVNLDTDSTREGVEVEGRFTVGDLSLSGSASFLDADQNGIPEIRRPEILLSGTATWTPTDALSLTVFADHTGTQRDTDFATFTDVELDAFTLVGASAAYAVTDNWTATVRGENLLDEDYEEVVGYRSPGAALFVGLRADY